MILSNQPLRLTLLAHSFPPDNGGGEMLIYLLAKYLSRKGWKISVVTGNTKDYLKNCKKLYKGFKVFRIPLFEEFSRGEIGIKYFFEQAYQTIKKTSPDIIHAFNFYPGYIGSIYARHEKIPLVFTYHNTPLNDGKILKMFSNVEVEKALVYHLIKEIRFQILITVSQYFVNASLEIGVSKDTVRWCYPGPDPEIFHSSDKDLRLRRSFGVKDEEILIIVPARIVPRKSIETLIESMNILKNLPVKVIISSGGFIQPGFEAYYNKIIKLINTYGLSKKILIPICQYNVAQLGKLYAAADFAVLPSIIEGLGLGALEVMQCGIPVIASDTEGLKEIIENKINGLLFPVGDFRALANHIEFLIINKKARQKMGVRAKETIDRKFKLSEFVNLHDTIYKELIQK
ncbi:MAG: glycosyltransferase family 4 protein [Candidatus Daviesbacteria bacterium]|nr:glycosyltransferase family 4 protein [Candidatus Daviesbacteria bacterium]